MDQATFDAEQSVTTPAPAARRIHLRAYGCQMNAHDAELILETMAREGYAPTERAEDADLVVLNTCHIREKAAEKVYSELGRLRVLKQAAAAEGRDMRIAVTGCVAQAEGREMIARAPVIDVVAGPQAAHRLPALLAEAQRSRRAVATDFDLAGKFAPGRSRQKQVAAFLTVQEGCDKFCSFCVVPYTRGAEMSRPAGALLDEARRLAEAGTRELTLLGQNVNAWHGQGPSGERWRLGELLEALSGIEGLERLRYTTSHPLDMDDGLIEAHRSLRKLMPYLHLPVQSGSDRILAAMNRRHDRAHYLDLVARIRAARPDIAMSGDFITGFPGEEERDFEDTLDLVRRVRYAQAFTFAYSPRPGTPAATAADQVPPAEARRRLLALQQCLGEQQEAFNRACVGQRMDVLVEKPGRRPGQMIARSPWLQSVIVEGTPAPGTVLSVTVTGTGPIALFASTD